MAYLLDTLAKSMSDSRQFVADRGQAFTKRREFLEGVRTQPEPQRVEVIRNESNLGFPAGCNRAAARARGCFLLFLNNDTVVTEGWLEGLLACAFHNWPTIGMVGPMTNRTGNDQQIPIDYTDLGGLDNFALRL